MVLKVLILVNCASYNVINVCNETEGTGKTKSKNISNQDIPKKERENTALMTAELDLCN